MHLYHVLILLFNPLCFVCSLDGDDDTMTLLHNNLRDTQSTLPVKFEGVQNAGVTARKLYWGCDEDITGALVDYPYQTYSHIMSYDAYPHLLIYVPTTATAGVLLDYPSGFDCIIASDVIYEEEQVRSFSRLTDQICTNPPLQRTNLLIN